MRNIILIALGLFILTSSLEARKSKLKHKIIWIKAKVDIDAAKALKKKRSINRSLRSEPFQTPIIDVKYEYVVNINLTSKEKLMLPESISQFLEPIENNTFRQIKARDIKVVKVGNIYNRSIKENYYICSYQNDQMICIREGISLPTNDVDNVLPKNFTRHLYTKSELEEIQNFYFLN